MNNKSMLSADFFKDFYTDILRQCTAKEIESFGHLKCDEDRFKFVAEMQSIKGKKFDLAKILCKNGNAAIDLKKQGNAAFQANNWALALDTYNEALMVTPTENVEDMSIVLANRSAVLYYLKQYKLAIKDIEMAVSNYPKDKRFKIKERMAKCYLALDEFQNSLHAFKETIHCLDESSLPNDQRTKFEKDAQIMLKILEIKIKTEKKVSSKLTVNGTTLVDVEASTELNDAVGFGYNSTEGRYAKANANIKVGDAILVERPHCAVLLEKYSKSHCQHCFLRTLAPLPCPGCRNVIFCSSSCKELALSTYHAIECEVLPLIWRSGSSINCHMALRMISQKTLNYFINTKNELTDNLDFNEILKLSPNDYRTVHTLVRHEGERQPSTFLQYSIMANFLSYCLRAGRFFNATNDETIDNYNFIGGLLLHNLQFLQYNTHEVYELRRIKGQPKTVFIGAGIYPTLARFNHSCNPSIVRYYKGTSVHVHAVANITAGQIIAENYGPIYSQNPYDERQATLKDLYRFDCICEPCTELWPLYQDMDDTKIRFKCSGGNADCNNVLILSTDCNEFMIKCGKCQLFTNILKGLKAVQDTDILKATAKRLTASGDYQKAAEKYREILEIMDEFMAPPFKDYCNSQQSYKECLLQAGNRNVHCKDT